MFSNWLGCRVLEKTFKRIKNKKIKDKKYKIQDCGIGWEYRDDICGWEDVFDSGRRGA